MIRYDSLLVVALSVLVACDSDGSSSSFDGSPNDASPTDAGPTDASPPPPCVSVNESEAPTAAVVFPPQDALTMRPTLRIRGTASDVDGIASITVRSVQATTHATTDDNFASWQAVVPLTPGDNRLLIESEDNQGNSTCSAAEVHVSLASGLFMSPIAVAADGGRRRVYVTDGNYEGTLISADLDTGLGATIGGGEFDDCGVLAVAIDDVSGKIYTTSRFSVFEYDSQTDTCRILSGPEDGTGSTRDYTGAVVVDRAHNRVIVAERQVQDRALIAVDLSTGERALLSGLGVGAGPEFDTIGAMSMDVAGDRLLLMSNEGQLMEVDLATGDRRRLAVTPWKIAGMAYDPVEDRVLIVEWHYRSVRALSLATGAVTVISSPTDGIGGGIDIGVPRGMAYDPTGNRVLVTDRDHRRVTAVDLTSGERTPFLTNVMGAGPRPLRASSMYEDVVERRLIVWNTGTESLIAIDLESGDRTQLVDGRGGWLGELWGLARFGDRVLGGQRYVIALDPLSNSYGTVSSDSIGTGPALVGKVNGMGLDTDNQRVLVSSTLHGKSDPEMAQLTWIDLTTGDRSLLVETGMTAHLFDPGPVILDMANDRALVYDNGLAALIAHDLATGASTILASDSVGAGPSLNFAGTNSMVYEPARGRVLMLTLGSDALMAIDLATGDRRIISDREHGDGPVLRSLWGLALSSTGEFVYAGDREREAIYAIDLVTGERAIISM